MNRLTLFKRPKFVYVYLFITLAVSLGTQASAASKVSWNLVYSDNLDKIATMGVKKIGGKSIQDLKIKGQEIYYLAEDQIKFENSDQTRRETARWNSEGPNYISKRHLSQKILSWTTATQINMHETLPRSGVDDDNFIKSSMIQSLIEIQKLKKQNPEVTINPAAEKALVDRLNNATGGGVTAVGGGGDYRVAEFVRVLILALFERLNSEKLDRTLEVEQFNKLMDIIEPLQINFRDGIKAGEFQYSPEQKKLYTPSVGVTSENSSIIQTSIEIFIDNLLQDLKK